MTNLASSQKRTLLFCLVALNTLVCDANSMNRTIAQRARGSTLVYLPWLLQKSRWVKAGVDFLRKKH